MALFRRLATAALACAACGKSSAITPNPGLAGLVQVSGPSPFSAGCANIAGPSGASYMNAEVEPQVAINPANPADLIAVWQQDRWSNGGAKGVVTAWSSDSGHSWSRVAVPYTLCAGGTFERASDPWVTFAPDGTAYQIALVFDQTTVNRAMLVARSSNQGKDWTLFPSPLQHDTDPDLAMDKESITADPHDASFVYAVWDRLTHFTTPTSPLGTGPAWFARTTDAGVTWESARQIYDPGADTQTVSNQIVVLPDGTLLDMYMLIEQNSSQHPISSVEVLRSPDRGVTWSTPPTRVASADFVGVSVPKNSRGVRTGNVVPSIAVDRASAALYVVWEDARFSSAQRDGIALSFSRDGGLSWSTPSQVNQAPATQAFTPVVSVGQGGKVGVTYFDLRNDDPNDNAHLLASHWLAVSDDAGLTWHETRLAGPFDLANAPIADGYFLGDYQGLVNSSGVFLPLFVAAHDGDTNNRTDVFFRPADAPAVAGTVQELVEAVPSLVRGARERWRFGTLFK